MPINKNNNVLLDQVQNSNLFKDSSKILNNNKLESTIVMKISEDHKKILEKHFKYDKGLALSSGIRQIIFEYMKLNNLI